MSRSVCKIMLTEYSNRFSSQSAIKYWLSRKRLILGPIYRAADKTLARSPESVTSLRRDVETLLQDGHELAGVRSESLGHVGCADVLRRDVGGADVLGCDVGSADVRLRVDRSVRVEVRWYGWRQRGRRGQRRRRRYDGHDGRRGRSGLKRLSRTPSDDEQKSQNSKVHCLQGVEEKS